MKRRVGRKLWCLVLAGVLASVGVAWAQPVKLPEVSVTATRSERPLNKVPQSVSVVGLEEIERLSPLTVTDLLRYVPGVMVRDFSGNGALAGVDMRGFGETGAQHTLVLIDGQRLNQIDLSGVDFSSLPVENIERIEILHGPAGVLYGDSAIGGVINIITRKGRGRAGGRLQASYGSYGFWGLRGYFQGTRGPFGWFVSARNDSTDGYRTNSETRLRNATFTATYTGARGVEVLVQGILGKANYSLPGALSEQAYNTDPTDSTRNNEWGEKTQKILRTRLTKDFGGPGVLSVDLGYRRQNAQAHVWGTAYDTRIDTLTLMPKYLWVTPLNGRTNRLTVGVDLFYVDMSSDRSYIGGARYRTTDYRLSMVGPYFLNELELTRRLTLTLGARYQNADYQIDNKPVGSASTSYSPSDGQWAMSIGLSFNPTPTSKLYARISRSFRYPTVEEYVTWGVFNPNLSPEKCWAYELGASYGFGSGGRISLAAYLMKMKDEIAYNPQTYLNENLEETEHRGLEASVVVPVGSRLSLLGSLCWQQARFTSGPYDGNDLPLVPEWSASVGAVAEPLKGLVATVRVSYVGERPYGNDKANLYGKLKDYTTVDATITYSYKRWRFFLNASNIFSEKYAEYAYASAWGKSYYPAPEARVWAGIAVSF